MVYRRWSPVETEFLFPLNLWSYQVWTVSLFNPYPNTVSYGNDSD